MLLESEWPDGGGDPGRGWRSGDGGAVIGDRLAVAK
jgi:hypothetical protein